MKKKSGLQIHNFYFFKLSKSLLKNKNTKYFLASKHKISQSEDIFIDIVKIRGMKYSSNS